MVDLSKLDSSLIAKHLGSPEGETGLAIADRMSMRNWPLYEAAFKLLDVKPHSRLLEIGFGNGKLVPRLFALTPHLTYTGIDISEIMVNEAQAFNGGLIKQNKAVFKLTSAEAIPFADGSFDYGLAINVIYFWPEPMRALMEIQRVLDVNGKICISVGNPEKMAISPFTNPNHGFRLYGAEQLSKLLSEAGFQNIETREFKDKAVALIGDNIAERESIFVTATASNKSPQ